MPVHIQRDGNIAVPQPGLNVFDIAATFAERIHRAVPQIVEAASQTMGLNHTPEVVGQSPGQWAYRLLYSIHTRNPYRTGQTTYGFAPVRLSLPADNPA